MSNNYTPPYGYRHIEIGGEKDLALRDSIDWAILEDYENFVNKVNQRTLYERGIAESYDNGGEPALGLEVEYFHPSITADDRMLYIMENIVSVPSLDWRNIICNTIISHFYGARGVHSVLTEEEDPKKAHVDFIQLAKDQINFTKSGTLGNYTANLRDVCVKAQKNKKKVWGTTELHTSVQTAGRRFVNGLYLGDRRHENKGTWANVSEWIASFLYSPSSFNPNLTVLEGIRISRNLNETFNYLTGENLIGEYYGYHCSTSNSVNPALRFNHDDTFVAPGPGARETLERMFPGLAKKTVSFGDRVVWIRENQHDFLNLDFHESLWNYTNSYGVKIFKEDQNELKNYGTEVSLCQYAVFHRLRSNPELISRRKIAREEVSESNSKNVVCVPKHIQKKVVENKVITSAFKKSSKVATVLDNVEYQKLYSKKDNVKENKVVKKKLVKTKTKTSLRSTKNSFKENIVLESIERVGKSFSHNQLLKDIQKRGLDGNFKLDSNWKETWAILQIMVKDGKLKKVGKFYEL